MKEWLTVTSPRASWIDLAREAHDFVRPVGAKLVKARIAENEARGDG